MPLSPHTPHTPLHNDDRTSGHFHDPNKSRPAVDDNDGIQACFEGINEPFSSLTYPLSFFLSFFSFCRGLRGNATFLSPVLSSLPKTLVIWAKEPKKEMFCGERERRKERKGNPTVSPRVSAWPALPFAYLGIVVWTVYVKHEMYNVLPEKFHRRQEPGSVHYAPPLLNTCREMLLRVYWYCYYVRSMYSRSILCIVQ